MKTWGGIWDLLAMRLVQLMGISGGSHVLDVGTGGGSTLLASLKCVGPTGFVRGIDFDEQCVSDVQEEIKRLNIMNAEVTQMDATSIEYPDDAFDYVISGFLGWGRCFDFTTNTFRFSDSVLDEMYRTLKPGGSLGISTWLFQEDMEWMEKFVSLYNHSIKRVYSKETEEGWNIIMKESPFEDYLLLTEKIEYTYSSKDDWWRELMAYDWEPQIESLVSSMDLNIEDVQESAFESVQELTAKEGLSFTRKVLFILADKS